MILALLIATSIELFLISLILEFYLFSYLIIFEPNYKFSGRQLYRKVQFWNHTRGDLRQQIYRSLVLRIYQKRSKPAKNSEHSGSRYTIDVVPRSSLELALVVILLTYLVINSDNVTTCLRN